MESLLLSPNRYRDSIAVEAAAHRAGWTSIRLDSLDFLDETIGPTTSTALYGEPRFGEHVSAWLDLELLAPADDWLCTLPVRYTRRQTSALLLEEVSRTDGPRFIKPASYRDKRFRGTVYSSVDQIPGRSSLKASLAVLVSEPVFWEVEYRCFVLESEVIAYCPYFRNGRLNVNADAAWPSDRKETAEAVRFAEALLDDVAVSLPPAVVVDIGRIRGRGWAVVEANPAWASGIYGCEPAQILPVLRGACRKRAQRTARQTGDDNSCP
jgi:hypothetical protein